MYTVENRIVRNMPTFVPMNKPTNPGPSYPAPGSPKPTNPGKSDDAS